MRTSGEWGRFLDHLNAWATARRTPTGIEVTFEQLTGGSRTVELVVTSEGWDEYWSVQWGEEAAAAANVRDILTRVPPDKPFLVYAKEQWIPSHVRDFAGHGVRKVTPEQGGEWVAR
ncbi:MAG TPA: hypothetical protein VNS46_20545 [Nocardioides sp.]|nr:hypothetical protein [Nocardioides sp.]